LGVYGGVVMEDDVVVLQEGGQRWMMGGSSRVMYVKVCMKNKWNGEKNVVFLQWS